jgi:hypothetical protein
MTKRPDPMPTLETLKQWIRDDHDGFAGRFHRARRIGNANAAAEIFEIVDGILEALTARKAPVRNHIERALLRIEELCLPIMELVPGIDDEPPVKGDEHSRDHEARRHRRTDLN